MKTIEILISPAGETHVETKGFAGDECRQASRFLEQALVQRTAGRMTAEYYADASQRVDERQGLQGPPAG